MSIQEGPPDRESKSARPAPRGEEGWQLLLDVLDLEPTFEAALARFRRKGRVMLGAGLGALGLGSLGFVTGVTWLVTSAIVLAIFAMLVGARMPREMLELNRMRSNLADLRLRLERAERGE
ncbi:MAG: hypothetical protein KAJ42_03950 [Gemmatimonadetes bacterium]|nr:hypothetical protein [Gemmatimonadota bacterium]